MNIIKDPFFIRMTSVFFLAGIITLMLPWWNHVIFDVGGNIAQDLKLNDSTDFQNLGIAFSQIPFFLKEFCFAK